MEGAKLARQAAEAQRAANAFRMGPGLSVKDVIAATSKGWTPRGVAEASKVFGFDFSGLSGRRSTPSNLRRGGAGSSLEVRRPRDGSVHRLTFDTFEQARGLPSSGRSAAARVLEYDTTGAACECLDDDPPIRVGDDCGVDGVVVSGCSWSSWTALNDEITCTCEYRCQEATGCSCNNSNGIYNYHADLACNSIGSHYLRQPDGSGLNGVTCVPAEDSWGAACKCTATCDNGKTVDIEDWGPGCSEQDPPTTRWRNKTLDCGIRGEGFPLDSLPDVDQGNLDPDYGSIGVPLPYIFPEVGVGIEVFAAVGALGLAALASAGVSQWRVEICEEKYETDKATCRRKRTAKARALCWNWAAQRYGKCLADIR